MKRILFVLASMLAAGAAFAQAPMTSQPQAAAPVVQPLPAPYIPPAIPANRWTPDQIRRAFDLADADSNGVLTRSEAQHLQIMPHTFEDMDENKDGVVTREEYESSFAR
jgi:hypothetical protein